MRVLVAAASRHGSTEEIATRIGEVVGRRLEVEVRQPDEVASVLPYAGVILGSGVYAGRWLARQRRSSIGKRPT